MVKERQIWEWLKDVTDPEIPVLTIVDMGVVRKVTHTEQQIEVVITPTYSGCPAMKEIEDEIIKCLSSYQSKEIKVKTVLDPAWTTDWISDDAKQKLEDYGIAPPEGSPDKNTLFAEPKKVKCPQCKSTNTKMISQFGSTACKAYYQCQDCLEPFDYFKCI